MMLAGDVCKQLAYGRGYRNATARVSARIATFFSPPTALRRAHSCAGELAATSPAPRVTHLDFSRCRRGRITRELWFLWATRKCQREGGKEELRERDR